MAAMESEKIRQPREKLNARPLAVWILLGVTMEERANILEGGDHYSSQATLLMPR
jgi:hypothetical protein